MSLPPALLQRLAQRGLVQKQKATKPKERLASGSTAPAVVENEEVIAEDYDEMDEPEQPSQYETTSTDVKRPEENFWLERMKLRIGEAGSYSGHKGCPNKYNIYHKCTLFCVNRWADGHQEPSRDYIKRYKRLLRRYPLPKGWTEMYDPGCGCFYFFNTIDHLVSWLPPTHPKSEITKCAAAYRRQLEEANNNTGGNTIEDDSEHSDDDAADRNESAEARHQREVDDIIRSSLRSRSPAPASSSREKPSVPIIRKQKSRDLEKTLSRQRREREHDRSRENKRDQDRSAHGRNRHYGSRSQKESDSVLDPMDPSSYSDIPRGKWSDGLSTGGGGTEERRKKTNSGRSGGEVKLKTKGGNRSDDDDDDDERDGDDYN